MLAAMPQRGGLLRVQNRRCQCGWNPGRVLFTATMESPSFILKESPCLNHTETVQILPAVFPDRLAVLLIQSVAFLQFRLYTYMFPSLIICPIISVTCCMEQFCSWAAFRIANIVSFGPCCLAFFQNSSVGSPNPYSFSQYSNSAVSHSFSMAALSVRTFQCSAL